MIHKTAIISDDAIIPESCEIGANVVIGKNVKLAENVKVMANAYLECCEIGSGTLISPFATIGTQPQDFGFKGEPTKVVVGKDCLIKEYANIHRAVGEGNITSVGDKCMLMVSTHIAHNCIVEDNVIMANLATLGGYVHVGKAANLGGMSVFHQHVRIGGLSMISGFSAARMDLLPFMKGGGRPPVPVGVNSIGLKRKGIDLNERTALSNALKIITSGKYLLTKVPDIIEAEIEQTPCVKELVTFMRNSERGITVRKKFTGV